MRKLSRFQLQKINAHIRAGGLIAYPTEAVYGLGCDPASETAITSLLALKSRSPAKGFIVIASDQQQLTPYLKPLTAEISRKLDSTWPGPVTWLLPAKNTTPKWLTGNHPTLACRISAHPIVRQLCQSLNSPLVSTSANLENRPPCRTTIQTRKQFGKSQHLFILAGQTGDLMQPTSILHVINNTRYR